VHRRKRNQSHQDSLRGRALEYENAKGDDWRGVVEGLRVGDWPKDFIEGLGEKVDDEDSMTKWVNRILFSVANIETSRLSSKLATDDQLRLALEREGQTDALPLSSLMTAYDSVALTRNRIIGARSRLMAVKAKLDGGPAHLLGVLSELDRYYICCDAVLACLGLERLTVGDRLTIFINTINGTRLMSLFPRLRAPPVGTWPKGRGS